MRNPPSDASGLAQLGQDLNVTVCSVHANPLPIPDQTGGMLDDLGHLALLIPCKEDDSNCENTIERPENLFPQALAPGSQLSRPEIAAQPQTSKDNITSWLSS